jgi:predicted nucleic acid-binding Zn ribbon protein
MHDIRQLKRGDYRRLAHFAQRIESRFMFGRVVPRLTELRPDLFVATIHDSILTTAGDAEFVRQVMLDEFARLGLKPQVKVEMLG